MADELEDRSIYELFDQYHDVVIHAGYEHNTGVVAAILTLADTIQNGIFKVSEGY